MEGAHIIEVDDLVKSMASTRIEEDAKFPLLHKMRRMPCDVDNDVYRPSVVSVGPYHHKTEATQEMEQTKWESFSYILRLNPEKKMRDYLEAIAGLEQQLRSCYASDINMIGSDELIKMMLLDGCFMFCILCGTKETAQPILNINMPTTEERIPSTELDVNDATTSIEADGIQQHSSNCTYNDKSHDSMHYLKHWYTTFSTHDLVLLENQIPFFLILEIFQLATNGNTLVTVLLENVARFMEDLLHSYPKSILKFDQPKELHHLLHLCHLYFKPNPAHTKSNLNLNTFYDGEAQSAIVGKQLHGWRRASEYHKAGVEFLKREFCNGNPHSLLDISFGKGVMEIPCLTIDPNTYCLFRNLIAFEETCPQFGNHMTTYVVFLSQFITMSEDISLLTKRGIIVNQLDGGAEVSALFNMLGQGITLDFNGEYYLKHIHHAMEMYYQMGRPRWREWFGSIRSRLPVWAHQSKPIQFYRRSSPEHRCLINE